MVYSDHHCYIILVVCFVILVGKIKEVILSQEFYI